ncbi:RelA/SpoT domain-containing protein [Neisseria leonii]|uniref:RelA/SpoT domain-containing protein n=1 Tax=Neisseria leonii TaxID=2995413 RepID=A0A9X4E0U4_9NEIS|nr:RelA/SpoT domain-containing protein [Neisseria sp. 51.81]MDD9326719.1 RelA/SpoT domain-containing protein [Neisseria sp. 51.81]
MIPPKKRIKKAGEVLRQADRNSQEFEQAMEVLSQWRAMHSYPINTFQATVRSTVKRLRLKEAVVAQRLKRTPSIIRKLQRFGGMSLSRMQDIGGLRIILKSVGDVYRFHDEIVKSRTRFKHKALLPPKDYIACPKPDGYRSIHQVFQYHNSARPELEGLSIELQIRTHLQHAWATAVETLGLIEKSSFKTGEGDEDYKRFFLLASALFAHEEKTQLPEKLAGVPMTDIVSECLGLESRLQIFHKLQGISLTVKHAAIKKGYCLILLDTGEKPKISLIPFENDIVAAERIYKALENDSRNSGSTDVVLVSVDGLKNIKAAYPNYFLDTDRFIRKLRGICAEIR